MRVVPAYGHLSFNGCIKKLVSRAAGIEASPRLSRN